MGFNSGFKGLNETKTNKILAKRNKFQATREKQACAPVCTLDYHSVFFFLSNKHKFYASATQTSSQSSERHVRMSKQIQYKRGTFYLQIKYTDTIPCLFQRTHTFSTFSAVTPQICRLTSATKARLYK